MEAVDRKELYTVFSRKYDHLIRSQLREIVGIV